MTCPRCRNRMESGHVMGGMAWICPTDGCGWFFLVALHEEKRSGRIASFVEEASMGERLAVGGRR